MGRRGEQLIFPREGFMFLIQTGKVAYVDNSFEFDDWQEGDVVNSDMNGTMRDWVVTRIDRHGVHGVPVEIVDVKQD